MDKQIKQMSCDVSVAWQNANKQSCISKSIPFCELIAEELYKMKYVKLPCSIGDVKYAYSPIEHRIIKGVVSGIWIQNEYLIEIQYNEDCYESFFVHELFDTEQQAEENKNG